MATMTTSVRWDKPEVVGGRGQATIGADEFGESRGEHKIQMSVKLKRSRTVPGRGTIGIEVPCSLTSNQEYYRFGETYFRDKDMCNNTEYQGSV